jgi:sporulation protein YlmC with PRC-barrel domain
MKMNRFDDHKQDVEKSVRNLIGRLKKDNGLENQKVREKLAKIGRPAVPFLISALASSSDHLRWEATLALGEIGDPSAAEALVAALQDESISVRWTAMDSLITLDRAAIIPLLSELRKDSGSIWLREGAHHVLHVLKDRGQLPPSLIRVFEALESVEPEMEVPWSVECALEELHVSVDNEEKRKTIMDIPIHAKVWCINVNGGTSTRVIIDPVKDKVTHLVVRENNFPYEERLVSVEHISESSSSLIRLNCTVAELAQMKAFMETEFVPAELQNMSYSMLWPYASPEYPYMVLEHERVPPNELAIRRGAGVMATDGRVGKVDEFLVEPESGDITHLVLREGHLWGQKDITIPISQVDRIEKNTVYLKVDKQYIDSLPAIPIHRGEVHSQGA